MKPLSEAAIRKGLKPQPKQDGQCTTITRYESISRDTRPYTR